MKDLSKILVIRLSSLGDILHTLPAFSDLRHSFPNATIDWVVERKCAYLLSTVKGIDTVHVFDKGSALPASSDHNRPYPLWPMVRALRRQHYDLSIDFQGLLKTAFLGFMGGASRRIGFPAELAREWPAHWFYSQTLIAPRESLHVLELNRKLAAYAGARPFPFAYDPVVSKTDRDHVEFILETNGLSEFVVVNPGGGWKSKNWKPEYYGALTEKIRKELYLRVVVTTGPGEEILYEELVKHCREPLPLHLQVSFLQLIPLLQKSLLLIGGDTGPFHLACALQTPVVGIFGPTSAVRNGPWNDQDETVTKQMACSGCYKRDCPTDNACMDIPVDAVFEALRRRLEKIRKKPI
ncbi:MAG: glycosyltransferase family 9 protein [Acidobacteriota bacterium]